MEGPHCFPWGGSRSRCLHSAPPHCCQSFQPIPKPGASQEDVGETCPHAEAEVRLQNQGARGAAPPGRGGTSGSICHPQAFFQSFGLVVLEGLPADLLRPARVGAQSSLEEKYAMENQETVDGLSTLENCCRIFNVVSAFKTYLFFFFFPSVWSRSFLAENPCCTASRHPCRACRSRP